KIGFDIEVSNTNIETVLDELEKKSTYAFNRLGNNITVTLKKRQQTYTLSGTVADDNNIPLFGANVYIKEVSKGTVTDENGFFSMQLPEGSYTLHISYIGFLDIEETIRLDRNTTKNYTLSSNGEMLDEVIITKKPNTIAEIKKTQMSVSRLTAEQIKRTPVVLGESDPLKSLLQLPGVTNAGEGSSGFNV